MRAVRVRLPRAVWDDPLPDPRSPRLVVLPGVYSARMNAHGAVFVDLPRGGSMGVKPGEFEFEDEGRE